MLHVALLLTAIAPFVGADGAKVEVPPNLRRSIETRRALSGHVIEFSNTRKHRGTERELFYSSRFRGGDQLYIVRGDQDGIIGDPARVGEPFSCSEHRLLLRQGADEFWQYIEHSPRAWVEAASNSDGSLPFPMEDIRAAGLCPLRVLPGLDDVLSQPFERFETKSQGSLEEVTGYFSGGQGHYRWLLDPSRDYFPLRCEFVVDGALREYTKTVPREYAEGRWFPERVEHFDAEGQLFQAITVLGVWEDPEAHHSTELSPALLGLFPGLNIMRQGMKSGKWDGERVEELGPFAERWRRGEIDTSGFRALLENQDGPGDVGRRPAKFVGKDHSLEDVEREPALWEEYVRRFIRAHRLDHAQTRKAWEILARAQPRGYKVLERDGAELRRLRKVISDGTSGKPDPDRDAQVKKAEAEYRDLIGPLEMIFRKELAAPLDGLLTGNQRGTKDAP